MGDVGSMKRNGMTEKSVCKRIDIAAKNTNIDAKKAQENTKIYKL